MDPNDRREFNRMYDRLMQRAVDKFDFRGPHNYARSRLFPAWGLGMQRPYRKAIAVGDRVVITTGALASLRAIVVSSTPVGRLTLRPVNGQPGLLIRISRTHVRLDRVVR
jgi:hypothetical protein